MIFIIIKIKSCIYSFFNNTLSFKRIWNYEKLSIISFILDFGQIIFFEKDDT